MSKELEEAIKRLEILDCDCIFYENGKCVFYEHGHYKCQKQIDIETVLKELQRLQEENNKLEKANKTYINSIQSITPVLLEDYIAKDKIKEKLEELRKEYKVALEENSTKAFIYKCQIEILKEILEEK